MDDNSTKDEYNDFLVELGVKIGDCRKNYGITQEQLAEKIGMSASTIHKIEAPGQIKAPSLHTLWRVGKALDVNMSQLFDNSEYEKINDGETN